MPGAHEVASAAKHRRSAAGTTAEEQQEAGDGTPATSSSAGGARKKRHSLVATTRSTLLQFVRATRRRHRDVLATAGLMTLEVAGYVYVKGEFLEPPDAWTVRILTPFCQVVFVLLVTTGAGVIFLGPGRVPESKSKDIVSPMLAGAMAVGAYAPHTPFSAENGWCFECNRWKPMLAHHCKICNRCSLWMDHHCYFFAQCIGFRNLRAFLLFLVYAQVLLPCVIFLALRRLALAQPPLGRADTARLLAFVGILVYLLNQAYLQTKRLWHRVSTGWLSQVLLKKYTDVAMYAHFAEHRYAAAFPADLPPPGLAELRQGNAEVALRGGGLRGLFVAGGLRKSLELVFGEPPSWRWLVPFRAGGPGHPLQPNTLVDAGSCEIWARLAKALEMHHMVMRIQMQMENQREQEEAERVQTLLGSLGMAAPADAEGGLLKGTSDG